jgi:tRNA A-37 threonylcarbamoyl transferase component Bud32
MTLIRYFFLFDARPDCSSRLCPTLYSVQQLLSNWIMVVMEMIIQNKLLPHEMCTVTIEEKKNIIEDLNSVMNILHDNDFVHGDLREPNILLTRDNGRIRANLIDFDFSGKSVSLDTHLSS